MDNAFGMENLLSFQRPEPMMQLALPPSPAVEKWQTQVPKYQEWWKWFNGEHYRDVNDKVKDKDGNHPPLYPLRVNDVELVCLIHAAALFGRYPEKSKSMIGVTYQNEAGEEDEDCKTLARIMEQVWDDSHGKEIQGAGGLMSQFLGGIPYQVKFDPFDPFLRHQVKFELLTPDYFIPIYDNTNYWNLLEVHVRYWIGADEALEKYGIKAAPINGGKVLYTEHWTKSKYSQQVGGQVPNYKVGEVEFAGQGDGFGFVPFVYIPHYPRVGGFYGASMVDKIVGLSQEKNFRLADIGLWVKASAVAIPWVKNVTSGLGFRNLFPGINAIDLKTNNLGKDPDLGVATLTSGSSGATYQILIDSLNAEIMKQGNISEVVMGLSEGGTQRSGVTVATRVYPLESHIQLERALWTEGLNLLHKMALRIMLAKGIEGVTEAMLKLTPNITWYPILPVDRAALVDEVVQRRGVQAISLENAIHKLSTGEDEAQEVDRIKAEEQEKANQEMAKAEADAQLQMQQTQQQGEMRMKETEMKVKSAPKPPAKP